MGRQQQTARRGGRTESVTIAAGARRDFFGTGDKINCLNASADLVLFVDSSSERIKFRTGIVYQEAPGDDFTQFSLVNESASSITVELYYGFKELRDDRTVISGSLSSPSGVRTTADTAIAVNGNLDFAADATRRELHVFNTSAVDTLRWGDLANTGDARGGVIAPNSGVIIASAGAIRIHNKSTAAGAVTVNIVELFEA